MSLVNNGVAGILDVSLDPCYCWDVPFEQFYEATFKATFRFFYYKSVQFDHIEDLAQECYMRFYHSFQHKLEDFDQSRKILNGICLNVYREWVRSRVQHGFVEVADWYESEEGAEENFEDRMFLMYAQESYDSQTENLKSQLRQAIGELNETVRKVIELRFIEGLSRQEVADQLGITAENVHTYQKRGIKYLKNIVAKYQDENPNEMSQFQTVPQES